MMAGGLMEGLTHALTSAGGSAMALPLALAGGLLAGLNPCCLPLLPAAAATCSAPLQVAPRGQESEAAAVQLAGGGPWAAALPRALAFVVGMAVSTAALGVGAAAAGRALTGVGGGAAYAVALVPILMGAHLLGLVRLPLPRLGGGRREQGRGLGAAFTSGLLISLLVAPCATPLLAAVLSYAALQGSLSYGALLLFAYGLGTGLPMLVAGAMAGRLARWLAVTGAQAWVERASGTALVGVGLLLLWRA